MIQSNPQMNINGELLDAERIQNSIRVNHDSKDSPPENNPPPDEVSSSDSTGTPIHTYKDYGLGLDCHSRFLQISVIVLRDHKFFEYQFEVPATYASIVKAKEKCLAILRDHSDPAPDLTKPLHYTIESTGCYHVPLIMAWGDTPSVVNPLLAGATKRKTDKLDAQLLAIHDLTGIWTEFYVPPSDVQELRLLIRERNNYNKIATLTMNRIINSLLKFGYNLTLDGNVVTSLATRKIVEDLISDNPSAAVSAITPFGIPDDVKLLLRQNYKDYDFAREMADDYLKRLISKAKSMTWETQDGTLSGSEMIEILTSAPGVGELTAATWLAVIITPRRFPNEKALAAYCGLDPSLKVSAGHVTSTTKRGGNKQIHSLLCQSASRLMMHHSEAFGQWGFNMYKSTGRWKKGTNAVGRKLACALYFMQRKGEKFTYAGYNSFKPPTVLNIGLDELALIDRKFKRYVKILAECGIHDTQQMVDAHHDCRLSGTRGLGKAFYSNVQNFISKQSEYVKMYEDFNREDA